MCHVCVYYIYHWVNVDISTNHDCWLCTQWQQRPQHTAQSTLVPKISSTVAKWSTLYYVLLVNCIELRVNGLHSPPDVVFIFMNESMGISNHKKKEEKINWHRWVVSFVLKIRSSEWRFPSRKLYLVFIVNLGRKRITNL